MKNQFSNLGNSIDNCHLCKAKEVLITIHNCLEENLQKITAKYENKECTDNFNLGGGLVENKFASNRHENAKNDNGKLTLGKVIQLFKKATGLETYQVKEIIKEAVPNMEWHHAGKLPKQYGGGMKKTYFLNSEEIVYLAKNLDLWK